MSKESPQYLTTEQVQFYAENGYLVVENFVSTQDVLAMKKDAYAFMEKFEANPDIPVNLFTTGPDQATQRNAYFQNSVRGVWPFFEEKALDKETGKLKVPYKQSINKIGHGMRNETHNDLNFKLPDLIGLFMPFSASTRLNSSVSGSKPIIANNFASLLTRTTSH